MLVKNLIFYQNLNRSLKYWAKSPFKMYKKRIQRPDFTKLSSVILLSELPISTLPTTPSTRKRALTFRREAKTPRSCCLHCQK